MSSLKLAFRSLVQSPGFALVSIVTLALGIGLNTAMFSLINTLMLRPLNLPHSEQLFRLDRTSPQEKQGGHFLGNALDLQRDSTDFADLTLYMTWGFTVVLPNKPAESLNALRVSSNFFSVLGVQPILGRDFRADDDQVGKNRVIILSYRLWFSHFSGDPNIIGKTIRLDGDSAEIIGVMPQSYSDGGAFDYVQVYRPLGLKADEKIDRVGMSGGIIGRYATGVTEAQVKARLDALASRLAKDFPKENAEMGLHPVDLNSTRIGDVGRKLTFLLLGLSGFVLLIACSNLANLLLARAVSRTREFAIRAALGASRLQLIRPIAMECIILSAAGGVTSLIVYQWTTTWMSRRFSSDGFIFHLIFDWRIIVFALLGSLVTALFFGLAPAWMVSRIQVNSMLKSGARGSTGDRTHQRFRQTLIVGQFGLALVLLTGAAAFVAGVDHLLHQRSGWNPDPLISGKIALPPQISDNPDKILTFYQQAQAKVGALPGVDGTAVSLAIPTFGFIGPRRFVIEGQPTPVVGHEPTASTNAISPEYFSVVGTHLLRGRGIEATDTKTSPSVVVINQALARALFPNGEAIGHRLSNVGEKDTEWAEIVGVVEDVHFLNVEAVPTIFQIYKPLTKEAWGYVSFTVKSSQPSASAALIQQIRKAFAELAPDLPMQDLLPVPDAIARDMKDFATINELLIGFALLGLFLAALGVYGVIARMVIQRTGEIGIRMALGAQIRDVVRLFVSAGAKMVFLGTLLGLIASIALAHLLATALPGLASSNSLVIASATALLIVVALLACWIPALRTSRVDPLIALRGE